MVRNGLMLGTLVAALSVVPAHADVLQPRRVLLVGDSEACRVGLFVQAEARRINDEQHQSRDIVEVDCRTSTMVQYWAEDGNFKASLERHQKPDAVLVFLGTNHWWIPNVTPDVAPITDLVKERGIDCLWVGNVKAYGEHYQINDLLREAVTPTCRYFDTEAANIPLDPGGVHPGREGAVKWIRAIWPLIPSKHEKRP